MALAAYAALVCLFWLVYHSRGHAVRNTAQARRAAAIGDGHTWLQFRTMHPYWALAVTVGVYYMALDALTKLNRKL